MLLHDSRNEDGIKSFFQEVHELYIKILLNPLYLPGSRITSSHFDTKVRALARKTHLEDLVTSENRWTKEANKEKVRKELDTLAIDLNFITRLFHSCKCHL
ncbi:Snare-like superfamily protein [Thalictrum thalictroides]|uniref:Snare-like superfamily protein n=1 Tax=Thalictrum thalictroides TaxID=46969 RepID=A0A7J6XG26_THATH|nr:Snare-like superfamily protein [Thalictrum thalictroides]